jgi:ssDNA-binding replication factor A large subunit
MTYTLMTQEHATTAQEFRTIESVSFAHKMGEHGGFYKVQLIDECGIILTEWSN